MIPRHQAERYGRLPGTEPGDHRRHLDAGPHLAGQPAVAATAHGTWIKRFGRLERPGRRCRAMEGHPASAATAMPPAQTRSPDQRPRCSDTQHRSVITGTARGRL
jgi:hypothetical protein